MRTPLLIWLVIVTLTTRSACCGDPPPAGGATLKEYPIRDIGTLYLSVPAAWQAAFTKTVEMGTPVEALTFQPRGTNDCTILVQVIHLTDAAKVRDFETRSACLDGAKPELAASVEPNPAVHDFKGAQATGSYVSVTDKNVSPTAPRPGEYKYLTLGYAKLTPVIIALRVISNRPGPEDTDAAVALIKSARLVVAK